MGFGRAPIGLTTARMAAARGAKLVLAARSDEALGQLASELTSKGTPVATVAADVGRQSDVASIARSAVVLYCAEHARREVFVGGASKIASASRYHMPRTFDRLVSNTMFKLQKADRPTTPGRDDALYDYDARTELRQRGGVSEHVTERSPYTAVSLRSTPLARAVIGGGVLFAAWGLSRRTVR